MTSAQQTLSSTHDWNRFILALSTLCVGVWMLVVLHTYYSRQIKWKHTKGWIIATLDPSTFLFPVHTDTITHMLSMPAQPKEREKTFYWIMSVFLIMLSIYSLLSGFIFVVRLPTDFRRHVTIILFCCPICFLFIFLRHNTWYRWLGSSRDSISPSLES